MTKKTTILVVDDDGPILLLMRNILREFGFESLGASNGAEALEMAREHRPDLVLLDKHMPQMGGEEVIRRLRGEAGIGEVPILILSGEPVEPQELARLGATAAILKPFDVTALIERIRATIGAVA